MYFEITVVSNVPDSISFDDLQAHLDDAITEPKHETAGERVERLCDIAEKACEFDELDGLDEAMVHKVMLLELATRFMHFHNHAGSKILSDDPRDERKQACSQAWFRDAGKFQAIVNILHTIEITDEDFTIPNN